MQGINWLKPKIDFDKVPVSISMAATILLLGLILYWPVKTFLWPGLIFFILLAFLVLILRREFGIYWLAALVFFNGFEISFAKYGWAQNLNFLSNLNAPLVDFVALSVFSFFIFALILGARSLPAGWFAKFRSPIIFYALFCLWALLGVGFAYERNYADSFHYWARFVVFSGVFLILPAWYIGKKEILYKVFDILFWVGVIISLFGLSSLFLADFGSWARVAPYGIGGFSPLGDNHNIIAQSLVAIIPLGIFLVLKETDKSARNFKIAGVAVMILSCLFTLSRAGWLCLAVTAGIFVYYNSIAARRWLAHQSSWILPAAVFVLAAVYMFTFLSSGVTKSSNDARLETARLAFFYTLRSPLIGHGPGSYIMIARDSKVMSLEFGEPLEAHGIIQKVSSETGIVGLFLFVLFLGAVFRELFLWQKNASAPNKNLATAVLAMAVSVVLFQLFGTNYFSGVMFLPLGIALAAARY